MIELWSKSQIDDKFGEARRKEILAMLLDPCADRSGYFPFADGGSAKILEDSHDAASGTFRAVVDLSDGPLLIVAYDHNNGITLYEQGHYRTRSVIVKEYVPWREL